MRYGITDGAMFAVIGFKQAVAYCLFNTPLVLLESHLICQCSDTDATSSPVGVIGAVITVFHHAAQFLIIDPFVW